MGREEVRKRVESAIASQSEDIVEINVEGVVCEISIPKMDIWFTQKQKDRFTKQAAEGILKTIYDEPFQ